MATAVTGSDFAPSSAGPSSDELSPCRFDDGIVRLFAAATIVWGGLAMLLGVVIALLMVMPKLFFELGPAAEFLSFGRLRPLHTNAAIFAFAGNAIFAGIYYSTQRLCQCRMWSDGLSRLHFWGWQAIIAAAVVTLPLGFTQGKAYAELEWPIDLVIALVWIGFFGVNFFLTLRNRREPRMHVSLWFYIATIVTVAILHVFNNLVVPLELFKSSSLYAGVQDAAMQWWYGHNLIGFFLIMPFLGLMYYFVPQAAGRPIYSYKLSILHFWSLVLICILAGPHHVHYSVMPEWLSTIAMLFGLMLWMPYWGGMINGLLTLRGAKQKITSDPVLMFFFAAILFYAVATLGGPLLSIRSVNALTHYSDWTIAHIHTGTLGWNGMLIFGMLYWLMPRLFQTKLWSPGLATLHFWIATIGILLYIVPIYAAGAMQGWMWYQLDDIGRLAYPDFLETIQSSVPFWWVRLVGGIVFLSGLLLLGLNFVLTWASRSAAADQPEHMVTPLGIAMPTQPPTQVSELDDKPVLDFAKRFDVWCRLNWHCRWEQSAARFTCWTLMAVGLTSLLGLLPMFLIRGNVPTIDSVRPYTPLELAGRDIYVAEGCYNCHSQMVRRIVAETSRFGDYSHAGESAFDRPFQWGTRRIGPDLARIGGRQNSQWHWLHLQNPQQVSPGSVMPSFEHLLSREFDFAKTTERVRAAHRLGAPYNHELEDAPQLARRQAEEVAAEIVAQGGPVKHGELLVLNSQAVALIAYLQRLGVDLNRPAEPKPEAVPEESPDSNATEAER
jgi:cytochrome c oxidase cbb3-type subunit I/II